MPCKLLVKYLEGTRETAHRWAVKRETKLPLCAVGSAAGNLLLGMPQATATASQKEVQSWRYSLSLAGLACKVAGGWDDVARQKFFRTLFKAPEAHVGRILTTMSHSLFLGATSCQAG